MRERVSSLAVLVVAGGCVAISHPPYPAAWPALAHDPGGCTAIAAAFDNHGVAGEAREHAPTLVTLLLGQFDSADRVAIEVGDGQLAFTAFDRGAVAARRSVATHCSDGSYTLPSAQADGWTLREGVAAFTDDSVALSLAADGALVVRTSSVGGGMMMGLPAGGAVARWYRYPRVGAAGGSAR